MKISNLTVGDIFHVERANGIRLIGLVTSVTESTIYARSAVNDQQFELDRETGTGVVMFNGERHPCTIYSTVPLPPVIHNTILELDRRIQQHEPWSGLSKAEIQALLYIADHYSSRDGDQASRQQKILRLFQVRTE